MKRYSFKASPDVIVDCQGDLSADDVETHFAHFGCCDIVDMVDSTKWHLRFADSRDAAAVRAMGWDLKHRVKREHDQKTVNVTLTACARTSCSVREDAAEAQLRGQQQARNRV